MTGGRPVPDDGFRSEFTVEVAVALAWARVTARPLAEDEADGGLGRYWLPGFDGAATVLEADPETRLRLRKDEEPCGQTLIEFEFAAVAPLRTNVVVGQREFGDWFSSMREILAVGWRHIVADVQAQLATGVHPARHMRWWGDLGVAASPVAGGLLVGSVREGTIASALGLVEGDVLYLLAGAPVSSIDDLATVLRVLGPEPAEVIAEVLRGGEICDLST